MNWLQTHVYLAAWLSLLVTTVGLVVKNVRMPAEKVNWTQATLIIIALACMAALLTPSTNLAVRSSAGIFGIISLISLVRREY